MSPTTIFTSAAPWSGTLEPDHGGRGVPGVGDGWVGLGGLYRVPTQAPSQDPIFSIFKVRGPTYGQMKVFLRL